MSAATGVVLLWLLASSFACQDDGKNRQTINHLQQGEDGLSQEKSVLQESEGVSLKAVLQQLGAGMEMLSKQVQEQGRQLEKLAQITSQISADLVRVKFAVINMTNLPTGRYYFHQGEEVKWNEANDYCEKEGMRLAVINAAAELEALYDAAPHLKDAFWLGGSDAGRAPGDYWWSDGREVDRWWWDRENGQPNDAAANQTAVLCLSHLTRGRLCDGSASNHKAYFICEA